MKNLIKQILKEETSGLSDAEKNAAYKLMNHITKGYQWYTDTPEKPFEYSPGSIWLINPETKEWVVELKEDGELWWYWDFRLNFKRYFNMEESDFHKFITIWVEDNLNREVYTTMRTRYSASSEVEDVLNRGKELK